MGPFKYLLGDYGDVKWKKKCKVQYCKYGCFLTVYVGSESWYHSTLLHLSLINIYTRSAVMNANLFEFCFFAAFKDVLISQPGAVLISQREVHFPETEESFCLQKCSLRAAAGAVVHAGRQSCL